VTGLAGIVLAAGEGRRFGGPKAPFVYEGERLVDRAVRICQDAGCDPVIVVLGAWIDDVPGAMVVINDAWPQGLASSLRAGLTAAMAEPGVDRVLVTLVDLPGMTAQALTRVAASAAPLAQGCFGGESGHPVLLGREHWAGVIAMAQADRGARDYLRAHAELVELVEVGDVASGVDLDLAP
jgi:CTP:molybdopterin cytidylyltransferase MocA